MHDLFKQQKLLPYDVQKYYDQQKIDHGNDTLKQYMAMADNNIKDLQEIGSKLKIDIKGIFDSYWTYILPLSIDLIQTRQKQQKPLFLGVLGVQGAGKTTFGQIITYLTEKQGVSILSSSIDDFYLSYERRLNFQKGNPFYKQRGPPGTHDNELLFDVTSKIMNLETPFRVPLFDKSLHKGEGDVSKVLEISQVPDIFILEGWFVGFRSLTQDKLKQSLEKIQNENEKNVQFAEQVNKRLEDFHKVYDKMQKFLILTPEKYLYSKQWRKDAEHRMKELKGQDHGMSDQQIENFVNYFWQALHPEIYVENAKQLADLVIELDDQHRIYNYQYQ